MQTALTDEQTLLRDTVRQLAADHRAAPLEIAAQRQDATGWEAVAELGLLAMRLPEQVGGTEAGAIDVALVAEGLAQAPAVLPFAGPVLAAELLQLADVPPEHLTAIAEGAITTIGLDAALRRPTVGDGAVAWDAAGATSVAGFSGASDGGRRPIALGVRAGEDRASADLTRCVARTAEGPSDAVGTIDEDALLRWEAFALTVLSADLVGTMAGALDLAVSYAKDRKQFGQPIGAFQALQHLLADAYVVLQGARSATYHAAWACDHLDAPAALVAARVAKAYAGPAAVEVCETATQVHGGMGTTWESLCHVYLRRAVTAGVLLGDEQQQLDRIADARQER